MSAVSAVRVAETCTACGTCLLTCAERALVRAPLRPLVVADRCTGCWECIEVCPRDAIEPLDGSRLAVMAPLATGRSRL